MRGSSSNAPFTPGPMLSTAVAQQTVSEMRALQALLVSVAFCWSTSASAESLGVENSNVVGVAFHKYVKEKWGWDTQFTVTNCSERPLWFSGYSLQSPLYVTEDLVGKQWRPSDGGWCGNGVRRRRLAPHTAIQFVVPMCYRDVHVKFMRVGVRFSPNEEGFWWTENGPGHVKGPKDPEEEIYWSRPVRVKF